MDIKEVSKQDFQVLIEKYLDGKISLEEVKLLVNYYESFQRTHKWVEALGPEKIVKQRMLINILEVLQEEDIKAIKIKRLNYNTVFKYAVAASIVLLISISFLLKDNKEIIEESPIVVSSNNDNIIKVGTDKAVLTLEDGSNIVLEKGKTFSSNNVKSNGEELIYTNDNKSKSEIVYNYLTVPRGGEYFIKLSDGTQVWLNSESQLKYPKTFIEKETRQVELVYGEAYFDVSPSTLNKGSKFKVINQGQEVEVFGTQFNIKAYKDENSIYTTLVEGKVTVSNSISKQNLEPNEQSRINLKNNTITINEVDVYDVTSWRKGLFSFKSMPLNEIMIVLSRWYDTKIEFADAELGKVKFNGVLSKKDKIENILTVIKNTKFINAYDIKDKTITIK